MCPQRCINLSSCSNIVPFVAFPLSDTLHSYRLVEEVQRLRASAIEKDALIAEINEQVHHYSSSQVPRPAGYFSHRASVETLQPPTIH